MKLRVIHREQVEMAGLSESTGQDLADSYESVRQLTLRLTRSLSPEDCMIQSMDDASPVRWHLAHTTWFFETFILKEQPGYQEFNEQFAYLFNSYYNSLGSQFPRPQRGTISRPGLSEILKYRDYVDQQLLTTLESGASESVQSLVRLGLHHEQQHQELILTDIKHALATNPLLPVFESAPFGPDDKGPGNWIEVPAGQYIVGVSDSGGGLQSEFCFDNERPQHTVYLDRFSLSDQLVTCGEYMEFIESGGYEQPEHWLSLGWATVQEKNWSAPLYWKREEGQWKTFTLAGLVPVHPDWPVCHVSYFEADAFARWSGHRLPTEFEWEVACGQHPGISNGQFVDELIAEEQAIHPTLVSGGLLGSVWQWTSSSYQAYPGFRPNEGAIGEYNGKFMCNQYVLRGGSVATSQSHIRSTYRNFFPASTRWQFAGIRVARM